MALSEQQQQQAAHEQQLAVYEQPEQDTIDPGEILQVAYRRRWIILLGILVVFSLGMLYTYLQTPIYQAKSTILVISKQSRGTANDLPVLADLASLTQARSVDTQVEILSSPDLLSTAFEKLPVEERLAGFRRKTYAGGVTIAAKKDTDIITITVQARTPSVAAAFANAIANAYMEQDLQGNQEATARARAYVEQQLAKTQDDFDRANTALAEFKKRTGLVAPDAQITQLATNLSTLQMEYDKTVADVNAGEQSLRALSEQLHTMDVEVVTAKTLSANPQVTALLQHISDLTSEKARLLQEYLAQSAEVVAIQQQINEAQQRLEALAKEEISAKTVARTPAFDSTLTSYVANLAAVVAGRTRTRVFQQELGHRQEELKALPAEQKRLAGLLMAVNMQQDAVELLAQQYQTLLISEKATLPNVRWVTHARPSGAPVSPQPKRNAALFLLLGLLVGVGLAVLIERLDDRIHDQETAEKLTGLVTMGMVHEIDEETPKIIAVDDKKSQLVERFRVLRNNISFSSLERAVRLIAVTSTGPGEGKSTCCTNLGIVMALDGKRVLIVDCDLHRPSVHNLLQTPRDTGFTNVVMGTSTLDAAVVATDYDGLSFLPAGVLPPNPSEVLNAQPTRQLFRQLADLYDIVILDCPPCAKLSDVQVIATIVDGMLLLVGTNRTLKRGLCYAYRALLQVSAPLMGLIMNRVDLTQHRYGYYHYYYGKYDYYSHYGTYEEGEETTRQKRRQKRRTQTKA